MEQGWREGQRLKSQQQENVRCLFPGFHLISLDFTWFHWVLLDFTGFHSNTKTFYDLTSERWHTRYEDTILKVSSKEKGSWRLLSDSSGFERKVQRICFLRKWQELLGLVGFLATSYTFNTLHTGYIAQYTLVFYPVYPV